MLRTRLATSYIKRTIRPLYGWTQATPKSCYLDPAWDRSVQIWPGMVFQRSGGDLVTLLGSGGEPYGLGALYVGGDGIDEPLDAGVNAFAVWVLGADAEFEILAPAFDTAQTWTDPTDGTSMKIGGSTTGANRGKLVPMGVSGASTTAIARLVKVNSATKITISGLRGTV